MRTTNFATTIEDLKLIIEETKDLNFKLEIENRVQYRDVLVKITADEQTLADFIDRNELSSCVGQITEL